MGYFHFRSKQDPLVQCKGLSGFCYVDREESLAHCSHGFAKVVSNYHLDTRIFAIIKGNFVHVDLKKPRGGGGAVHLVIRGAWERWVVGVASL